MKAPPTTPAVPHTPRKPGEHVMLPFRVEAGASRGHPTTVLYYTGLVHMLDGSKKRLDYSYDCGVVNGSTENDLVVNPLGAAILTMMRLYHELQRDYDQICRTSEDDHEKATALKGDLSEAERRIIGLEARNSTLAKELTDCRERLKTLEHGDRKNGGGRR